MADKLQPWEIDELYGQLHLLWDIVRHADNDDVYRSDGVVFRVRDGKFWDTRFGVGRTL